MGLETRGSNYYYYDKERNGDKVRSVYVGKGEMALMFHWMKEDRQAEKDYEKQKIIRQRSEEIELEKMLDALSEISRILTDGFYLVNGFHQHKRQWRRKRNVTEK